MMCDRVSWCMLIYHDVVFQITSFLPRPWEANSAQETRSAEEPPKSAPEGNFQSPKWIFSGQILETQFKSINPIGGRAPKKCSCLDFLMSAALLLLLWCPIVWYFNKWQHSCIQPRALVVTHHRCSSTFLLRGCPYLAPGLTTWVSGATYKVGGHVGHNI